MGASRSEGMGTYGVHMQRNEELGCSNFSKDCPWLNKIREHFLQSDRDDVLEMMFERNVRWTTCPVRSAWFAKSKSEGYQERIVFFFLPLLLLLLLLLPLSPSPPPPYLLLRPRRPPPPPPAIPSAAGNPSRVRGLRNRWSFEIKLTRDAMSPWRNCVKTVRVPSPNCACSKLYRRNNYHESMKVFTQFLHGLIPSQFTPRRFLLCNKSPSLQSCLPLLHCGPCC